MFSLTDAIKHGLWRTCVLRTPIRLSPSHFLRHNATAAPDLVPPLPLDPGKVSYLRRL